MTARRSVFRPLRLFGLGCLAVAGACGGGNVSPDAGADALILPDERAPCAERDPLRRPFFGDLHVHTSYSFDAVVEGNRLRPEDAYAFARGVPVGLAPFDADGNPHAMLTIDRPLDFAAVTDHADLFGETELCNDPTTAAYQTKLCTDYREPPTGGNTGAATGLASVLAAIAPRRPDFCEGGSCEVRARDVWQRTQDAAEAAYDRTAACTFTTLVGYEWSGAPLGANLHRNVLFRNRQVPTLPITYVEAAWPEELWRQLESACQLAGTGCDSLIIPHNSNLSAGQMYVPIAEDFGPLSPEGARRRATMEPLVEIYQHKGSSECSPGFGHPLASEDELCRFENVHTVACLAPNDPPGCTPKCSDQPGVGFLAQCAEANDFVRPMLGEGLREQLRIGANPFQIGFVASTDSHNATPGAVSESAWMGHLGSEDATLETRLRGDHLTSGPGGLAVVWAEENSRESIFEAMRRKETYATSGPRHIVRVFGGADFADDLCETGDFAAAGYQSGVPMGGVIETDGGTSVTSFELAVSALRDAQGGLLDRVQVIKGTLSGAIPSFQVIDIAGGAPAATVDPLTCARSGGGFDELCSVWRDPGFDPRVPSYYYVRVVETPSCRWHAWQCVQAAVDCATEPADSPRAACCDPSVSKEIRERSWTSPIFVVP